MRDEQRDQRRFERSRFVRAWREWLELETTHRALVPMAVLMVLSAVGGWSLGAGQGVCPTLALPSGQTERR